MKGYEHLTTASYLRALKDTQATIVDNRRPRARRTDTGARPTDTEEQAWQRLERLAHTHGWVEDSCWHSEDGLRCLLMRGQDELLYVVMLRPGQPGSEAQQARVRAARRNHNIEVVVCPAQDTRQLEVRLAHRRIPQAAAGSKG